MTDYPGHYQTTLEIKENALLDFALDRGDKIARALDYISMAKAIPMGEYEQNTIEKVEQILKGELF